MSAGTKIDLEKPLAVSVMKARELLGVSNNTIWDLIKSKRVRSYTLGKGKTPKRFVVYASLVQLMTEAQGGRRRGRPPKQQPPA